MLRKNYGILQQYRNYPKRLSERTHQADQYVIEITSFVESFTSQVTWWLQDNANRFSKWVDTVVLLIGIVKDLANTYWSVCESTLEMCEM